MQRVSGALTAVGIVGLLYAAVSLFSTLRVAVSNVFREDWHRVRKWTPGLAFDVRMALMLGVLFVAIAILTVGAQLLDNSGIELMRRVGIEADWMLSGWRTVAHFIALFVPLLLGIGMFFQLYYFVPLPHPPRAGVLLGACVAAILWEVGKYFFTSYATGYGRYDTWLMTVESDRIGMLGDIFGLIVAFVLWAYYSGVVLMIGGSVVVVHEIRRRERKQAALDSNPPDNEASPGHQGTGATP
jgi:membrane protein